MHRREDIRIDTSETVTATILGKPDRTVTCHIVDFSRSGMGIVVVGEVPEGSAVKVDWGSHFLVGRVVRTSAEGQAFRLGLEFLYCSQWQNVPVPL